VDVIKLGQVVFVSPKAKSVGLDCEQHRVIGNRQAVAALLVGGGDVKTIGNSHTRKRSVQIIELAIVVVVHKNYTGRHGHVGFGFFAVGLVGDRRAIVVGVGG